MADNLADSMRRISGLLQTGRFVDAEAQLEALLAANPRYLEGLRLLAGAKQALGNPAAAEALLRHALKIDPAYPPTLTMLAEMLMAAGRSAEAEPLLLHALNGPLSYPRAAQVLARRLLDTSRAETALQVLAPWCSVARIDGDLAALHVAAYAALGRADEAVSHYRGLASLAPDSAVIGHGLAAALIAAGQPQEGERILGQALSRTRPTAAMHYTHARALIGMESFEQAERALTLCVQLEPRHAEAHNSLAQLVWMRTGSMPEALQRLDASLRQFAQDDALWATKAALLQGAGEPRAAFACLEERAARPHAAPALLIRAGLAALDFDPSISLALAERALRSQANDATARKLRCAALLGVGDAAAAEIECSSLIAASPDDQYLIAMRSTALRLQNDDRYAALCDYDSMVLSTRLETPSGWPDLRAFLAELSVHLEALHNPKGHRLLYQSLRQGTETTQDLSRSQDRLIQALFKAFAEPIERYRAQIGSGDDPLRRRNQGGSRFNGSWSVRLHSAGFHTSHVHPRGWISSACYIQLPDSMTAGRTEEGSLSFGTPGMLTSPTLAAELSVRPEPGQLVLFPSYFWHGTLPFHSEQPRLTVAFDVVPDKAH